jgi:pimeloyl-ACP methyl ester carboxylesterase
MTPGGHAAPADVVARLDSLAVRRVLPCAAGSMVWREWGAGPPLLLLHGASGAWTHWIRNILPLAARFRVLAPDMPGYGDSDAPPEPHTAEALAGLVASALQRLVPPPHALDIGGFSFGGIVGSLVAESLGGRVRALVLLGTGGLGLPPSPTRPLVRIRPDASPDEARRAHRDNLGTLMIHDPERIDDLAVHLQMEHLRRARFRSGAIPASDVVRRALPRIRARVAGIWAERDAFVGGDVEAPRRILASVRPELDFRVIAGAGHWVTYEAADRVTAALLDVLTAPPSGAGSPATRRADRRRREPRGDAETGVDPVSRPPAPPAPRGREGARDREGR